MADPDSCSGAVGALGYDACGRELLAQAPDLDTVVVALGSGGTMAGLVHALGPQRVLGVHCGAVDDPAGVVSALLTPMDGRPVTHGSLRLRTDQVGPGYSALTDPVMDALTRGGPRPPPSSVLPASTEPLSAPVCSAGLSRNSPQLPAARSIA
ncbi:hypothetical protein ACIP2X_07635 [Streptomyces sp. NPDC089424]|uniref:hypothetical protein n=1 Tax=Streptomyces sp. NPDC089424 TaxID=3365917 RepID=UPI0038167C05